MCDTAVWATLGKLPEAVLRGESAFESMKGVGLFEYFENHPALAFSFNEFMTRRRDHGVIARTRDFSAAIVVVDVGGGHGETLIQILKANAHLRGVLFDLPHVVTGVTRPAPESDIAGRLVITGGDFFEAVPEGGDLYLLEDVLHDWADEDCLRILSTCRRTMRLGSELLIAERVLPESGAPAFVLSVDVFVMATLGGKERTESEFGALLDKTGFRLKGTQHLTPMLALVSAEAV